MYGSRIGGVIKEDSENSNCDLGLNNQGTSDFNMDDKKENFVYDEVVLSKTNSEKKGKNEEKDEIDLEIERRLEEKKQVLYRLEELKKIVKNAFMPIWKDKLESNKGGIKSDSSFALNELSKSRRYNVNGSKKAKSADFLKRNGTIENYLSSFDIDNNKTVKNDTNSTLYDGWERVPIDKIYKKGVLLNNERKNKTKYNLPEIISIK